MNLKSCEFFDVCTHECEFSLKRKCSWYFQFYLKSSLKKIGEPFPSPSLIREAPVFDKPACFYFTNQESSKACVAKNLSRRLVPVKVFTYNTAIQASLEDYSPNETLIYINMMTRYPDPNKGYQVIESFVDSLIESGKYVVLYVKPDYINKLYTRC